MNRQEGRGDPFSGVFFVGSIAIKAKGVPALYFFPLSLNIFISTNGNVSKMILVNLVNYRSSFGRSFVCFSI